MIRYIFLRHRRHRVCLAQSSSETYSEEESPPEHVYCLMMTWEFQQGGWGVRARVCGSHTHAQFTLKFSVDNRAIPTGPMVLKSEV